MKEIKRRNAWIAFSLALVVFLAGVFVINWQLWHSDQATHVAAARQAAKKIAAILDEAHAATATALNVSRSGCSGQGQFQLGTGGRPAAASAHYSADKRWPGVVLITPRQPSPDAPSGILA
ncbi:hypothetical protein LNO18_08600 [Klebsiella variicola subsp. variicola]|nr:hypothetical protein [Klebsiella variicola subsp. variicola]